MKAIRIPVFVLVFIVAAAMVDSIFLTKCCNGWTAQSKSIERLAASEKWDEAEQSLDALYDDWSKAQTWLHIIIDHDELNTVESLLERGKILVKAKKYVDLTAGLTEVRSQFHLLSEIEQFNVKNIL